MSHIATVLGNELLARPGVVPAPGGCVLVVGHGAKLAFPHDVLVVTRMWGEAVGELKHFDRVIVLAGRDCPNPTEVVAQALKLVRPDGLLVILAARPFCWGVRKTVWWNGVTLKRWLNFVQAHAWVVVDTCTIGFNHAVWRRLFPWAGVANVLIAQRRVGGIRVVETSELGTSLSLKKALPGACNAGKC